MLAHPILLQKKYARIVVAYAKERNKTVEEALDYFYHSIVYTLMSQGISDMHCMSDAYLVEELILRENEAGRTQIKNWATGSLISTVVPTAQTTTQATTQTTTQVNLSERDMAIVTLLLKHPDYTQVKLANALKWDVNTVKYYINKLKKKSVILRHGTPQNGYWEVTVPPHTIRKE